MKIQVHPEATTELVAQQDYYDARLPGLGRELEEEIDAALGVILSTPDAWEKWPGLPEVRVFVLSRFPFSLPYWHDDERLVLLAIAHAKRRPGYWRARIRDI